MNLPKIIQGGMGVAISDWRLAHSVAREGQLGVVSGTGVALILAARLQLGDPNGDVRRALSHFPFQEPVEKILKLYYTEGGIPADQPYKRLTMWSLNPPRSLNIITVMANFVEVWLAKEGHNGPVGINLLEKVQMPNMASLYGAMLAGVDYVIMGAGIPIQIAGILDKLVNHQPTSYRIDVLNATGEDDFRIHFDPEDCFPGAAEALGPLQRPMWLPIISSNILAQALLKRSEGKIDGFVIESPIAGGHNAPPRGKVQYNDKGEPIYTEKDTIDLQKMRELGLPFWLAGGWGTPEGLKRAIEEGAAGVQVGTAFAYCDESGMDALIKQDILTKALREEITVRTDPTASPTGFPFKVVQWEGSVSNPEVYDARTRICDIGYLRHVYKREDGKLGYRCSAEPIKDYVRKGGKEEDAEGRSCLCNNLSATAGFGQRLKDGGLEPPIITSGDVLEAIVTVLKPGQTSYSAKEVIDYLLSGIDETAGAPMDVLVPFGAQFVVLH